MKPLGGRMDLSEWCRTRPAPVRAPTPKGIIVLGRNEPPVHSGMTAGLTGAGFAPSPQIVPKSLALFVRHSLRRDVRWPISMPPEERTAWDIARNVRGHCFRLHPSGHFRRRGRWRLFQSASRRAVSLLPDWLLLSRAHLDRWAVERLLKTTRDHLNQRLPRLINSLARAPAGVRRPRTHVAQRRIWR